MFNKKPVVQELIIPNDVYSDPNAREVVRAWIANNGLSVALEPTAFGKADTWGILLVDLARHVSRGLEQEGVDTFEGAMHKIRSLFDAEWDFPTDMGTTSPEQKQ